MPKEYRKQGISFENDVFKTCATVATALVAGIVALTTNDKAGMFHYVISGVASIFFFGFVRWAFLAYDNAKIHLEELKEEEQEEEQ